MKYDSATRFVLDKKRDRGSNLCFVALDKSLVKSYVRYRQRIVLLVIAKYFRS